MEGNHGTFGETESFSRQSAICGDADWNRVCAGPDYDSVRVVSWIYDDDFEQYRSFERGRVDCVSRSRVFRHRKNVFRKKVLSGAGGVWRRAGGKVYAGVRAMEAGGWANRKKSGYPRATG